MAGDARGQMHKIAERPGGACRARLINWREFMVTDRASKGQGAGRRQPGGSGPYRGGGALRCASLSR